MRISVITVCYNAADTIGDTLASVARQTHADLEHIIVDGGSTDDTLAIVRQHGQHVARIISEPDQGLYDAMNKGWRAATGELVGYLHADDIFADDGAIAAIADAAKASEAAFVLGDIEIVRRDDLAARTRYYMARGFTPHWFEQADMPPHPGIYHRRELFDRFGGYSLDYKLSADFDFLARLLYIARCSYEILPRPVVKMREGGASSQGLASNIKMLKETTRACRALGIPTSPLKIATKYVRKALQYAVLRPQRG